MPIETRAAGPLTVAVALLSAGASLAGLLVPALYRDAGPIRSGWIVNDGVTLLVAVPVLVVSMRRARAGSRAAHLVWIGALHYALYDYCFYLFGAALNELLLVYAALVGLSIWALVLATVEIRPSTLAWTFHDPLSRRVAAWMTFVGVGLAVTWTAQWLVALLRTTPPGRFDLTPEFIRLTAGLDLSLVVSPFLAGAVLLWRRHPWGLLLGTAMNVSGAIYNLVLIAGTVVQIRMGLAGGWPMLVLWAALSCGCAVSGQRLVVSMQRAEAATRAPTSGSSSTPPVRRTS